MNSLNKPIRHSFFDALELYNTRKRVAEIPLLSIECIQNPSRFESNVYQVYSLEARLGALVNVGGKHSRVDRVALAREELGRALFREIQEKVYKIREHISAIPSEEGEYAIKECTNLINYLTLKGE